MTEIAPKTQKKKESHPRSLLLFGAVSLGLLLLFLYDSSRCLSLVNEALLLCFERVIPALFPFMVLSAMILSSGILSPLSRLISPLCRSLLGVGGESGCVWLLGLLCGFPVAASSGLTLYREGRIGEKEFKRLMLFSNNPSISFLLGGVGVSLFNSTKIGFLLCTTVFLSSLFVAIFLRGFAGSAVTDAGGYTKKEESPSIPFLFCRAVTSSTLSLLSVLGFVIFFYTLTGMLSHVLHSDACSSILASLLPGLFEVTGGISRAAEGTAPLSYTLSAALAGFSGLSVHCQIASILSPAPFSLAPYLLAKVAQGFLCALLMGVGVWMVF
ncbi:MAG: hypothetical protein IKA76_06210 [Clostridia bacterium]|nr:hypothetical protein [Clostridia bacterium]